MNEHRNPNPIKAAERAETIRARTLSAGITIFTAGALVLAAAVAFTVVAIWQPPAGPAGGFEWAATGGLLAAIGGGCVAVGAFLIRKGAR